MKADVDWSKEKYPWNDIGMEFRQSLIDGTADRPLASRILAWAKQLKDARVAAGLKQWSVAISLGVHNTDISDIERGVHGKEHSLWQRLADFYGITLSPP